MSRIHRAKWLRLLLLPAMMICFASPAWAVSHAGSLLPAETDVSITFNPRRFLHDCRDMPLLRRYLEQWRLAAKGDQKQLLEYYEAREIQKYEGISRKEFLERAGMIKAACDALENDPFEDVDFITVGWAAGDNGFLAIIVEGRFKQRSIEKLEQFFKQQLFPVNQRDGAALGMLDNKTLVFADNKKTMEAIQARARKETGKVGQLPAGVQALLESGRKQHFSVVVNRLDANAPRLTKFVGQELAGSIGIDPAIGKLIAGPGVDCVKKNTAGYAAASFGISIRDDGLRLEIGVDAREARTAEEQRKLIDGGSFWGALALKAFNHDLARQLAGVLTRKQVTLKDTTLIVRSDVPYEFIENVFQNPLLDIFPELHKANAATTPLPGQEALATWARQITSIPLWKSEIDSADYKEVRDLAYTTGPGTDLFRHRLDMFLPRNKKNFPIVVLVHGGGWEMGDNRGAGLYSSVGQFLAGQGIGAVLPNYRLSPAVKHPEHVKDVARAVAWVRSHAGKYGGDSERIYLMGHSAGGHLVALLAADESYLKAEQMKSADIKGVIPISGVYRIPAGLMYAALGGSGPRSLRIEQMLPLRGDSAPSWKWQPPGLPLAVDPFGPVFGDSEKQRTAASPIAHVRRDMPPFLILSAEHDLPTLGPGADEFNAALRDKGCDSRLLRVPRRNHSSLMFSAINPQDPAARAIVEFVRK